MISSLVMSVIGVALILLELLLANFVFIFFGCSFVVVGLINLLFEFSWEWQLISTSVLSLILIFTLRKRLKGAFHKDNNLLNENFLDGEGIGQIKEGMVYYKGTFWKSDDIKGLKDGDNVVVLGTANGKIDIKR
ncbi:MAG: NfeD family protein [Campylobacter sp.]|nr:NfeD family protein [Campylobacter sp.]